jgi:cytochrome d ubiquinol oxidase subunit II
MFSLDNMNHVTWGTDFRGLEAVLTFHNVALGLAVLFLARVLGLLYFINSVENSMMYERSKKHLLYNTVPFLVFFLYFLIALLFKDGVAYQPENGEMVVESFKYLHNLLALPVNTIMLLIGVVLVLYGIISTLLKGGIKGIWWTGSGTVLTVWALFILAGFNQTSFYPSGYDLQSSLTIENASSSRFTLVAMSYVSLAVPFVIGYIWIAWKAMNNKQISSAELDQEHHTY